MALPSKDYVALVFARSGLGIKKGVCLSNGVGVIDSDYRGEIAVGLVNLSGEAYTIQPGERVAQLCIACLLKLFSVLISREYLQLLTRSFGLPANASCCNRPNVLTRYPFVYLHLLS